MDLKKRKRFPSKKEGNLSLFFSYCFSFQRKTYSLSLFLSYFFSFETKKDLVLVKFYYNAAGQRFLKTFRKFAEKRLQRRPFLLKFQFLKWTQLQFSISFSNTFLQLLAGIERKRIALNNYIIWCKNSSVFMENSSIIKYLSKNGSFFLFNVPKY